jgi:hypothetical protein
MSRGRLHAALSTALPADDKLPTNPSETLHAASYLVSRKRALTRGNASALTPLSTGRSLLAVRNVKSA